MAYHDARPTLPVPTPVRSDNGGEYINKRLQDFLHHNGVVIEHTVARTPQQNGIAERFNRTIME